MAMMEWNDKLKVGHRLIDRDHQRLVELINALSDAMSAGKGRDVCGDVLNDLINYTKTHFAMEEQLMSLSQYPAAGTHKAEHAKLVQEVVEFQAKFNAGKETLSVSLLHFLMEWLTHHILVSDKALAQGIPPG
ncbi:MAG: bacteriohemerythrin [Sterolibacterium sp.]